MHLLHRSSLKALQTTWTNNTLTQNLILKLNSWNRNTFSFLDIKLWCGNDNLTPSVYRKPTFSGVFTNSASFIPLPDKFGIVNALIFCCFLFRSSLPELFYKEGVVRNFAKFTGKLSLQRYKKRGLVQVFSCEFCEISKNAFSYRTSPVAASSLCAPLLKNFTVKSLFEIYFQIQQTFRKLHWFLHKAIFW